MDNSQKNIFVGITDVSQAETIISQYRRDYPEDLSGAESLLSDLLEALYEAEQLVGEPNDFHNFSVSISKIINDSKKANYIVQQGLKIHPLNTDLLADAIRYGYNCGEKERCREWYDTLNSIDQLRWSWRAFSFSIDYLLKEWISNTENNYSIEDILKLARDYQNMLPDTEDAWFSEYEIYAGTNQREKSITVLENAMTKFKFCPRCWLRYADIMIDDGEYEKAEPIIRKMRKNPKTREAINTSYMYFLDAQCKIARLYASDEYDRGDIDKDAVWMIYKTLRMALLSSGLRENIKTQIDDYIMELSDQSGEEFPDEWRYRVNE